MEENNLKENKTISASAESKKFSFSSRQNLLLSVLMLALVGLVAFSIFMQFNYIGQLQLQQQEISSLKAQLSNNSVAVGTASAGQVQKQNAKLSEKELIARFIPSGAPDVYGSELGVSFDEVEKSLYVLANLDKSIEFSSLTQAQKEKYLAVSTSISCEYCCGAESLTTKSGEPACGCSHSYAMRGIAKYLVTKHPELSEEQVLNEVSKWKAAFFPKPTIEKALYLQGQGQKLNDSMLGTLKTQVGGC